MGRFAGKVALVTGGAVGIGRATALCLARDGADIALIDLDLAGAERVATEIRALGRRAAVQHADVARPDSIGPASAALVAALGPIAILVNNAGIARIGPLLEIPDADWHATFAVNVDGVFNTCRAVMPAMVVRKSGMVINLASWLGKRGQAQYGAYAASKFAVIGFTQSLALEMAPHGIRVNAVCPGLIVETSMRAAIDVESGKRGLPRAREREKSIPLGRVGYPDDVARVIAFLASDDAAYVTGAAYDITGGTWMS